MDGTEAAVEQQPADGGVRLKAPGDEGSVRSFSVSAQQVYERFEKLPLERRKAVAEWVKQAALEEPPSVVLPKGVDGAEGRPERWRVLDVDTQRWIDFAWKPLRWTAVNSRYETPEQLFRAGMAYLDDLAVPLTVLANRYSTCPETVCVDLPVRYGVAMAFIRAQARASERQLAGEEPGNEERLARDLWLAEGLSADDYRTFALQLFSLRQERDPPFVLAVFRGVPEKAALIWFRDIHLAGSAFCKGLFPSSVEHLYWANHTHRADIDPPKELCERPDCKACAGLASDARLLSTFQQHMGPWRLASKDMVTAEMKRLWQEKYQPRLEAARREMSSQVTEAQLQSLEQQLVEQAEAERPTVLKRVEQSRALAFRRCGRCKLVKYCSAACQKEDWPRHGKYCVERKRE